MTNATIFTVAPAVNFAAIMIVAAGISFANATASSFSGNPGNETPFRATKGDRLNVRPEIRMIPGVIVVLRDSDGTIR